MRHLKNIYLKVTAFFFILVLSVSLQAQEKSEVLEALDVNLQLVSQLDQFNLHVSNSYVDCFCNIMNKDSQDPLCKGRGQNASFLQTQINYEGQEISETRVCESVVQNIITRTQKISKSARMNLALFRSYEKFAANRSFNIHMERPMNREHLQQHILPHELVHMQNITENPEPLQPLSPSEIDEFFKNHYAFADEVREKFLNDVNYQKIFKDADPLLVANYLKTGQAQDLQNNFSKLKKINPVLASSPWFSINGLNEMYRMFLTARKLEKMSSLKKMYEQDLNALPLLMYLKSPKPAMHDLLVALLKINKNAQERSFDAKKSHITFKTELNTRAAEDIISDYAVVVDHGLSQKYMAMQLRVKQGWSKEKIDPVLIYLQKLRASQKKTQQYQQIGLAVGSALACMVPYPGTALISAGAKLLVRNLCFLGLSGGVNTYFVLESRAKYMDKIETFLSTPDGWNQMTKINQVLEERSEYNSWLLFYVFEFQPVSQIAKYFLRL